VKNYYDSICSSLLILDSVEVEPAYRGHGIGLLAARHAIDLSDNGTLVACGPFPLQFAGARMRCGSATTQTWANRTSRAALEKITALL
jgi:hypothetical protein